MIADSEILTYVFLAVVAFLFVMIFWNVLGAPRKRRRPRANRQSRHDGDGGTVSADFETVPHVPRRRRRNDADGSGSDDGDADGSGGDSGGGDGGGGD